MGWRRTSSWKLVLPPSMIVSPGSRWPSSSSICASVASPAGTMIQTARGFSSLPTSSSIENATSAPSPPISRVFSGVRLYATISCWSRSSRRTMFAPIRPRPMKPIRIRTPPLGGSRDPWPGCRSLGASRVTRGSLGGVSSQNRSDHRNTRMTVPPTKRKLRATAGASSARAGSHRRSLDRLDLVEPPNVPRLAAERRAEEGACALDRRLYPHHARTEREDVHVVVLDALVRGIGVVADRRPDARHLAGRDRRADAGAADEDPAVRSPGPDRRADGLREVRIVVVRVRAVAAEIDELVLTGEIGGKTANELGLERCPGVVGGERDAHRPVLSRGRDRSRPTGRPRIRPLTASGAPPRRGHAAPRAPRRDRGTPRGPPAARRSPRARP